MLNYLLRTEKLTLQNETKVWRQGEGPVNTIGYVDSKAIRLGGAEEFVLNNDGSASPVVHQYDRFEHLRAANARRMQRLFADSGLGFRL